MKDDISAGIYTDKQKSWNYIFFWNYKKNFLHKKFKKRSRYAFFRRRFSGGGEIQIGSPHPPQKKFSQKIINSIQIPNFTLDIYIYSEIRNVYIH